MLGDRRQSALRIEATLQHKRGREQKPELEVSKSPSVKQGCVDECGLAGVERDPREQ